MIYPSLGSELNYVQSRSQVEKSEKKDAIILEGSVEIEKIQANGKIISIENKT